MSGPFTLDDTARSFTILREQAITPNLIDVPSGMPIEVPELIGVTGSINGNSVRQVRCRQCVDVPMSGSFSSGRMHGFTVQLPEGDHLLVVDRKYRELANVPEPVALWHPDGPLRWTYARTRVISEDDLIERRGRCERVRRSWHEAFSFREQRYQDGQETPGLRTPQIGAVHAVIAHWKVGNDPATIVMPTGTGKTETMLALLVCEQLERLLEPVMDFGRRR